jgi:acetolactate synthase-1/2/3 large subunit
MGFGLPAGMGAAVGKPGTQVIAFIGDGGFQMTMQELGTILQYNIPVKIVILNNDFLGMVRQWQDMFFDKRYAMTELINPNFVKIAEAFSIPARKVVERKDLMESLKEMLDSPGPYLLDITVEKEANVFPMVTPGASVSEVKLSY